MEALGLQWYDVLMIAVAAGTTLFGFWKGMAWQAASLASVVVSAVVAIRFAPEVAPMISEQEPWNRFVAMLILYVATSLCIWVLSRLVAKAIDRVRLKEFDRQLGAMFGLAKGVLLCIVITFFVVTLSEPARQAVLSSYSGKGIAILIKNATPVLPKEVTDVLGEYINKLDRKLDPTTPPDEPTPAADSLKAEAARQAGEAIDAQLRQIEQKVNQQTDQLKKKMDDQLNSLKDGAKKATPNTTSTQGSGASSWWR